LHWYVLFMIWCFTLAVCRTPGPNKQPAGAIRRHEAWSPPLTRSQVQVLKQGQAASQPEGAAPKEAARSADCSPGRPSLTRALALVRQQQGHQLNEQQDKEGHAGEGQRSSHSLSPDTYRSGFSIVQQDVSLLPAKRPPNWQELKIWAAQPGLIQFDNVLPQQVPGEAGVAAHALASVACNWHARSWPCDDMLYSGCACRSSVLMSLLYLVPLFCVVY
jgi:hypothetical protein